MSSGLRATGDSDKCDVCRMLGASLSERAPKLYFEIRPLGNPSLLVIDAVETSRSAVVDARRIELSTFDSEPMSAILKKLATYLKTPAPKHKKQQTSNVDDAKFEQDLLRDHGWHSDDSVKDREIALISAVALRGQQKILFTLRSMRRLPWAQKKKHVFDCDIPFVSLKCLFSFSSTERRDIPDYCTRYIDLNYVLSS